MQSITGSFITEDAAACWATPNQLGISWASQSVSWRHPQPEAMSPQLQCLLAIMMTITLFSWLAWSCRCVTLGAHPANRDNQEFGNSLCLGLAPVLLPCHVLCRTTGSQSHCVSCTLASGGRVFYISSFRVFVADLTCQQTQVFAAETASYWVVSHQWRSQQKQQQKKNKC